MEYKVIRGFTDRFDSHKYAVGDRFPYRGFAKKERIAELSSTKNRRGVILIEAVKKAVEKKPESEEEISAVEDTTEKALATEENISSKKGKKNNE